MLGVGNDVPTPNDVPPVGEAYQFIVPADAVAAKVIVPDPHMEPPVFPVIMGGELTVTPNVL
jgi:hypothetical protein